MSFARWFKPAPAAPDAPLLVCPNCRSRLTYVIRHIIVWQASPTGPTPKPAGATVQCLDCPTIWHATERGAELAKPLQAAKDAPRRDPKPKDDSDLKWPWRDR